MSTGKSSESDGMAWSENQALGAVPKELTWGCPNMSFPSPTGGWVCTRALSPTFILNHPDPLLSLDVTWDAGTAQSAANRSLLLKSSHSHRAHPPHGPDRRGCYSGWSTSATKRNSRSLGVLKPIGWSARDYQELVVSKWLYNWQLAACIK